jgi:hypothetical protein
MAEGIVYLDVDDEITSAAQRIRAAAGTRVALVVPYGSRIATSRMNFRLLSREAVMNNRRLSIVSGDAAARSLAASAGLPVFGSVGENESAGGASPAPETPAEVVAPAPAEVAAAAAAAGGVTGEMAEGLAASETVVMATPAADDAPPVGRRSQRPKRPIDTEPGAAALGAAAGAATASAAPVAEASVVAPPGRPADLRPGADDDARDLPPILGGRIRGSTIAVLGLLVLALVVAGVGAYVFLPSASVTLVPRQDSIGPLDIDVSADPTVTVVDPEASVVPALRLDVPVEAARTFTTTGKHVEESAARGSVTFTNYDTSSGVTIPSGSVVSTEGGVRFRTQRSIALQPASIFPVFAPSSGSVQVVAARPGEAGNVPANTIRVVPQGQDPNLLKVNNPADTSGGTRTETPEITQAEVDKAVSTLQADLAKAFADAVAAGASAPPDTTLFPETADLGTVTPDVDPKTLVGKPLETFDLKLTAKGTVIAVDPRPVETIARTELLRHVAKDHRLIEDSVQIVVGDGTVGEDSQVTFQATIRAAQVLIVDPAAVPGLVKGKTKAEAEAALAPFGRATVTLWPDWATTVTAIDARLSVDVEEGAAAGPGSSPAPGGPGASPSPRRSAGPPPSTTPGRSPAASAAP